MNDEQKQYADEIIKGNLYLLDRDFNDRFEGKLSEAFFRALYEMLESTTATIYVNVTKPIIHMNPLYIEFSQPEAEAMRPVISDYVRAKFVQHGQANYIFKERA